MYRSVAVVLFVRVSMGTIRGGIAQTADELDLEFEQADELPLKPKLWITSDDDLIGS